MLFYFLVGLALAAGADSLVEALREPLDAVPSLAWRIIQLVVGIVLIILSYIAESRIRRSRADGKVGRLEGWRSRALSDAGSGSAGSLVKLALVGTSIELLTMLPYLAAIAMLTAAGLSPLELTASIAVYCLVMVIPAHEAVRGVPHQHIGIFYEVSLDGSASGADRKPQPTASEHSGTACDLREESNGDSRTPSWIPLGQVTDLRRSNLVDVGLDLLATRPASGHASPPPRPGDDPLVRH